MAHLVTEFSIATFYQSLSALVHTVGLAGYVGTDVKDGVASLNQKGNRLSPKTHVPQTRLLLGVIFCIAFLMRLPDLVDGMHSYFPGDDHTYSLLAGKILLGDFAFPVTNPYVQFAITRYSMLFPLAGLYAVLGVGDLALAVYQVLVTLTTIWIVFHLGKLLFDRERGLLAALLVAMLPMHIFFTTYLYPDALAAAWSLAALTAFTHALLAPQRSRSLLLSLLAGVTIVGAYFTTISVVLFLPVFPVGAAYLLLRGRVSPRRTAVVIGLSALAAVATSLPVFLIQKGATGVCFLEVKAGKGLERFESEKGGTSEGFFGGLVSHTRAAAEKLSRRFGHGDPLLSTFGIARQYVRGAIYYAQGYAQAVPSLFVIGIVVLALGRFRAEKLPSSATGLCLVALWVVALYTSYEILGLLTLRKLMRYFMSLHLLVVLFAAGGMGLWLRERLLAAAVWSTAAGLATMLVSRVLIGDDLRGLSLSGGPLWGLVASVLVAGMVWLWSCRKARGPVPWIAGVLVLAAAGFCYGAVFDRVKYDYGSFRMDEERIAAAFGGGMKRIRHFYVNSSAWLPSLNYCTGFRLIQDYNGYWDADHTPPPSVSFLDESNLDQLEPRSLVIVNNARLFAGAFGRHDLRVEEEAIKRAELILIDRRGETAFYRTPERPDVQDPLEEIPLSLAEASLAGVIPDGDAQHRKVAGKSVHQASAITVSELELDLREQRRRVLRFHLQVEAGSRLKLRVEYREGSQEGHRRTLAKSMLLHESGEQGIEFTLPRGIITSLTIMPTDMAGVRFSVEGLSAWVGGGEA